MSSLLIPTIYHYLILSVILFSIGAMGIFLIKRNTLIVLMSIELMLLAVNFNFVTFSRFLNNLDGQIFVFFILTVAAVESAIGLTIMVLIFRNNESISIEKLNTLKD